MSKRASPTILERDEYYRNYVAQFLDLEALFAIDWAHLRFPALSAGGEEKFPYALCDLTSPDPTIRIYASMTIDSLQDEGIISELTALAVPFLLQLVCNPATPERTALLECLSSIVSAFRYQAASGPRLDHYIPAKPEEFVMLRKNRLLIATASPVFIEFLAHSETATRKNAGDILACLSEQAVIIGPVLEQAFLQEQDELLKAHFLENLGELVEKDAAASIPWFEHIRLTHESALVRFVATARLPFLARYNTSPEVVASLINLLETEPETLRNQYMAFKGYNNPELFYYQIVVSLYLCDPATAAFPALLRQFHSYTQLPYKGNRGITLAQKLLDFVFPRVAAGTATLPLDVRQQQFLAAVCAYDRIWSKYWWAKHLREHGLPDKREDLRALLS